MADTQRTATDYSGVFYRLAKRFARRKSQAKAEQDTEKVFYIVFKKDGKVLEEKVGRQFQDAMTPAKASAIRAEDCGRDCPFG